jgi:hypothetical protein
MTKTTDAHRAEVRAALEWFVLGRSNIAGVIAESSFRAALREARGHTGRDHKGRTIGDTPSWPGAMLYLIMLEQIGKTVIPTPFRTGRAERSATIEALRLFAPLVSVRERDALYALRNAFAHDFSLTAKPPRLKRGDTHPRCHRFELDPAPGSLVSLPRRRWNGLYGSDARGGGTRISLRELGDLVEGIVEELERRVVNDELRLRRTMSAAQLRMRFTLMYPAHLA